MLAKLCYSDQLYVLASTRRIARLQSFPTRIAAVDQSCHRLYQPANLRRLGHGAGDELLPNIRRWNLGTARLQMFIDLIESELNQLSFGQIVSMLMLASNVLSFMEVHTGMKFLAAFALLIHHQNKSSILREVISKEANLSK